MKDTLEVANRLVANLRDRLNAAPKSNYPSQTMWTGLLMDAEFVRDKLAAEQGFRKQVGGMVDRLEQRVGRLEEKAELLSGGEVVSIVFDGPPGPNGGRFVEIEAGGMSIDFGEWVEREDGLWEVRLT